jgi:hypothetical protein
MKVWVLQWPNGAWSTRRAPFGAQPVVLTKLVFKDVSSTIQLEKDVKRALRDYDKRIREEALTWNKRRDALCAPGVRSPARSPPARSLTAHDTVSRSLLGTAAERKFRQDYLPPTSSVLVTIGFVSILGAPAENSRHFALEESEILRWLKRLGHAPERPAGTVNDDPSLPLAPQEDHPRAPARWRPEMGDHWAAGQHGIDRRVSDRVR